MFWSETFPNFAVIDKETSLINKLEGDANELFKAVQSVAGSGIVDTIFDLTEKGFDRLVDIVRGAKNIVVFLKIRGGDVGVGGVQVIQYGAGGDGAISDIIVSEGADEQFVNGGDKNLSESLVGAIVLVEECVGGVERIAKFSDLGDRGVGWDDGFRAGVDRQDEGSGRQGVVDSG